MSGASRWLDACTAVKASAARATAATGSLQVAFTLHLLNPTRAPGFVICESYETNREVD